MTEQHILRAFDRDLEAIQEMVMRMGGMVESAILQADKAIDALEKKINEEAARLIALRAPAASDLRTVLTVMKIAASLERVGDYAKNMAKRANVLGQMSAIPGAGGSLRRMARAVVQMLSDALDAYNSRDVALAEDVRNRDRDIDQMYNALFREFLTHMMEDPRNITACMHLHFIAKNVERMGDHATTIAEQVIYLVTGALPDEKRPKADSVTTIGVEGK
jgi:phosphate transport system protein